MKKRYKILSVILALAIVLGSIVTISVFSSSAEWFTDENGIKWTVEKCYPGWAITYADKTKMVGDVVFPEYYNDELIVAVNGGDGNFKNCTGLTSVTFPDSYEYINTSAFEGCTGLTSIDLGNGMKDIGPRAFYGCTGLTSVTFPDGLRRIQQVAFYGCTGLTSIDLGSGVEYIENSAFGSCTSLSAVEIPDSVKELYGFSYTGLTSITIPYGVTKVGNFTGCTNLTSIEIPSSVTSLGGFSYCTGLTSIDIPDSVTSLGSFNNCTSLTSIEIPYGVTEVGSFKNCTNLTSVTIPDSINELPLSAFQACTGLTSVTLSNNLKSIGEYAFEGCTNLTSITIPNSVTIVGDSAFENCSKLRKVNIDKSNIKYIGPKAFDSTLGISSKPSSSKFNFTDDNNIKWTLYPNKEGCYTAYIYSTSSIADLTSIEIPDNYKGTPISEIGGFCFRNCTNLTSVTIPNSITKIDSNAFEGCTGLTSVEIPDSVTYLSGFKNCTNLTSIEIPNSVTTIGASAFNGCTGLTSIEIPSSVTTIEGHAFNGCKNLSSIQIPNSVTTIGGSAFMECYELSGDLIIPDSVTEIDTYAFYNCHNLNSIHIGNGIKTIKRNTFSLCSTATSITIPDSVTRIEQRAFSGCTRAFKNGITIGRNIEYVGECAFAGLGTIDSLTIETPKTSNIHITAFQSDYFKSLVVGDTVKEIDSVILSGNKDFASVGLGSNITNITDNAFFGNTNMNIVTTPNADVVIDYANKNNIPFEFGNLANVNKPVDFEVTCDKSGYEFTVYRVADLEAGSNPYVIRYDSLITDIEDEIFNGDSVAMLEELDKIDSSVFTEVVGTYNTDVDGSSKMFEDLPAGIYYVRATNFPANVYSVQNSVFALPYYTAEDGWIYELSPIPLATKVDESNPEIVKTITNSTKDNVNFTDVSLGDTVNFEIEASRVGSANVVESKDFKLKSYVVSDIMESGLTLNQDSFVVTLEDIDGNTLATLENTTDYVVNIVANEGADTTFTVALTPEYLAQDEFYSSANVVIAYSAVLNKYSTREFDGNYNTATDLTYSNKTNVTSTVEGNTVYAYTFGIEVNKYDDAGTPLAGSEFGLYLTEDDAKFMKNAIATGTSTDTGKVEFFTESNDVIRLASGTYYIVETKATENYNRYTDVIPVTITAEYSDTETNGTYLLSAPENGIQLVEVKNSKVVIPNTGGDGAMYRYLIALAFAMLAVTLVVLKKRNTKKATATK